MSCFVDTFAYGCDVYGSAFGYLTVRTARSGPTCAEGGGPTAEMPMAHAPAERIAIPMSFPPSGKAPSEAAKDAEGQIFCLVASAIALAGGRIISDRRTRRQWNARISPSGQPRRDLPPGS